MSFDRLSAVPQRAELLVGRLAELGVKMPTKAAQAWKRYQELGEKTPPVHEQDLRDAVLAGADHAELVRIAAELTAHPLIENARLGARTQAAVQVVDELERAGDDLHKQLAKLAEAKIDVINRAAAVGDTPLDALVRSGRHDEASALAQAGVAEKELEMLIRVRERLWPKTRPPVDCSRFREARYAGRGLLEAARAGATLWFGSHAEVMEHGQQLAAAAYDEPAEVPA